MDMKVIFSQRVSPSGHFEYPSYIDSTYRKFFRCVRKKFSPPKTAIFPHFDIHLNPPKSAFSLVPEHKNRYLRTFAAIKLDSRIV